MTLNLDQVSAGLNQAINQINGSVGNLVQTAADAQSFVDLARAARESIIPDINTNIAGFRSISTRLPSMAENLTEPLISLSRDIPISDPSLLLSDQGAFLHEIATVASPDAIADVLGRITSLPLNELEDTLQNIGLPNNSDQIVQGIEEMGRQNIGAALSSSISNFSNAIAGIESQIEAVIPNISGAIVDDLIRNIDPDIIQDMRTLLTSGNLLQSFKVNALRNLVRGNLQETIELFQEANIREVIATVNIAQESRDSITALLDAGEIEEAITEFTNLNIPNLEGVFDAQELETALSSIIIDPMEILGANIIPENVRQILPGLNSWDGANTSFLTPEATARTGATSENQYAFDYVDTAEEFEADIASSTRELYGVVHHYIPGSQVTAEAMQTAHSNAGLDGIQYHYILRIDGSLQRGRPISSPGISGEEKIDLAIVGTQMVVAQNRSYREMMKALYRVIPGADQLTSDEVQAEEQRVIESGVSAAQERATRINPATGDIIPGTGGGTGQTQDPSSNQQRLTTINTRSGQSFRIATAYASNFEGFIAALEATGYVINEIGGYRESTIAGTNTISWHQSGVAIDINPSDNDVYNGYQPVDFSRTNLPRNISEIAAQFGLGWGGDWIGGSIDTMHFSLAENEGGSISNLVRGVVPNADGTIPNAATPGVPTGTTRTPTSSNTSSPYIINNCINGRGGFPGGNWSGGGNSAIIQPYPGPGVSTQHQLTGNVEGVDGRLRTLLETAAANTGLSPVCSSGNRGPGGSGRHNGFASDTGLYNGDVLLSVTVPSQLALIQEFTRQFLIGCKNSNQLPSVGMANHAYSILYMGGTYHHFDIARGNVIGVGRGKYWGGSGSRSAHIPVPGWVVTMFSELGL